MTTMRFGLSASFPGYTKGSATDDNWAALATGLRWTDTVIASGSSAPLSATYGLTNIGSVEVPVNTMPDQLDEDSITVSYGALAVPDAVKVISWLVNPISEPAFTEQDIMLSSFWNTIKDVEVSNISAQDLHVTGFVDTWINAASDNQNHTVSIDDAKRGAVMLGNGNDKVQVNVAANEYTWSSHFDIIVGNGNDTVEVMPQTYSALKSLMAPAGWTFNSAPQLSTADITVGNGNDTVGLAEISGTVHVGSGNDTINISDGNSVLWLGSGNDTVTINTMNVGGFAPWAYDTLVGTSTVHVGAGHADITIDDTAPALTPRTTINFIRGQTGGNSLATADVVRYGHYDGGTGGFVGGDLSALTIDLIGYSPGSIAVLSDTPPGSPMLLQVHDAAAAPGSLDAVALYGGVTASTELQHVRFV